MTEKEPTLSQQLPTEHKAAEELLPDSEKKFRGVAEQVQAEEALGREAERLRMLLKIDKGILAAQSMETIAQAAVTGIRQLIPCQRVGVTLFDFAAHEAILLAIDTDTESQVKPGARIALEPFEDAIANGRQGKMTTVAGLQSRGWVGEALHREGISLFVVVPILSRDELIGSVNFNLRESDPSAFTYEYEDMARHVADQLAIAFRQARLFEQVQRHAEELEKRVTARTQELAAFFDLATLTSGGRDLSEILEPALTRIFSVARCQAICVHLLDEEGSTLKLVSQRNLPDEVRQQMGVVEVRDDFLHHINRLGDPIVATTLAAPSPLPDELRLKGFRTYLGVPLRASGDTLGWQSYYRASEGGFTLDESTLLAALTEQISVIVENHRLRLRIEQAAVMQERGRLARELHDSVTQSLYSIVLLTEVGRRVALSGDVEASQDHFSELEGIALQALKEMRLLVFELRPSPLEEEGLVGALQERLDAVEGRAGVKSRLLVEGEIKLSKADETELYGITQEALNNTLRHAMATSVTVHLRSSEGRRVELEIYDDGCGFDSQDADNQGGMGLATMRERAEQVGGMLEVISTVGEGTRVRVVVGKSGGNSMEVVQ